MSEPSESRRNAQSLVSAAFEPENLAAPGDDATLERIAAQGPRGALALAGLSVAALVALWLAFFVFVFLPRGEIG
jgi:hypothetical protein